MRFVAIIAAALVVASSASATLATGFRGHVTIGPLTPVCSGTTPCDGPAAHVTLAFHRNGVVVKRVETGDLGGYRILLRYGPYTVTASRGMRITPMRVWARRGHVANLDFVIDTGIR